jgi:hypothetical protein
MSALSETVVERLSRKGIHLASGEVEDILEKYNVPTSTTKAVPVPLRAAHIKFSGTKQLTPFHPDAAGYAIAQSSNVSAAGQGSIEGGDLQLPILLETDSDVSENGMGGEEEAEQPAELVPVPFAFEWAPQAGVNGIGSGKNLRGKSTVLNVLLWALTGRCAHFQPDIQAWIERVEVDWTVGGEHLRVRFDAADGVPTGVIELIDSSLGRERVNQVGQFDGEDQFEGAMESLMMTRLRLETIPVWTDDRAVIKHAWPAYSSAFTVRANALDPIVGNESTIATRMMQMFVGADWAPAAAAVTTARRRVEAERDAARSKVSAASELVRASRERAQAVVDDAKSRIAALPSGIRDLQEMLDAAAHASDLSREVHVLETRLLAQVTTVETVKQQLKAARASRHTEWEDALAAKFFHRMQPKVCPRCASAVTKERQAAEADTHECSVCTGDLNLKALGADVIISASVPDDVASSLIADMAHDDEDLDDDDVGPADDVMALEAALEAAESAAESLREQISQRAALRDTAAAAADASADILVAADERRLLDLELARAEGALSALTQAGDPGGADPIDPMIAAVLEAAETVIKALVKNEQDPLLQSISTDIERLAVGFGADSLSNIRLNGAANMSMVKGGKTVSYGKITDGEKLRVKIATAIALIKHGYVEGVGRHPGLLVLDSPASEEMPEEDLATIVAALNAVAVEAQMQIFIATRNAQPLIDLLPAPSCLVTLGEAYVW